MAVTPGSKILATDMAALADAANSVSTVSFDLTDPYHNFYNVSPLFFDGNNNPYGHKEFSGVSIDPLNSGTGYKVGDVLSLGFGSAYEVEMVSSTGAVLGIRILNNGAGQYNDPTWDGSSGTRIATSGGSGSDCQLGFGAFSQVGPTASYSFPDFTAVAGAVTSYYLVAGGSGYVVNETLTFAEQKGAIITVNTVDSNGKILTFTVVAGCTLPVPQNVSSMNAVGTPGAGAKFGGFFTLIQKPQWLTELNRLRNALFYPIGNSFSTSDPTLAVSGPWPVSGPSWSFQNLNFYYADTGKTETVTVGGSCVGSSSGKFTTAVQSCCFIGLAAGGAGNYGVTAPPFPAAAYPTSQEATIIIGGNQPELVQGDFYFCLAAIQGFTCDVTGNPYIGIVNLSAPRGMIDPSYLVKVDTSAWRLGDFDIFFLANTGMELGAIGCGYVYAVCHVNQMVAPGRYSVKATGGIGGSDSAPPFIGWGSSGSYSPPYPTVTIAPKAVLALSSATFGLQCGPLNSKLPTGYADGVPGTPSFGTTFSSREAYPGIHNSEPIWKVHVSDKFVGFFFCEQYCLDSLWNSAPFPQPTFGPEKIYPAGIGFNTSTPGLWTASCPMISDLNAVKPASMPWNLPRTSGVGPNYSSRANPMLLGDQAWPSPPHLDQVSNSYDQTLLVESQAEPPGWIASRYFTVGFNIMDGNGNLEIVTIAGVSGTSAPTWPQVEGQTVTDNGVTWKCRRMLKASPSNLWHPASLRGLGEAITDSNGNTQVVTGGGTTGGIVPVWSTRVDAKTKDGSVVWAMRLPINAMIHRAQSIPRYPIFWQSETIAALLPPTSSSGLTIWGAFNQWQRNRYGGIYGSSYDAGWQQDNLAFGWWIYSVSLNRCRFQLKSVSKSDGNLFSAASMGIGAGDTSVGAGGNAAPGSGEVSVTIGCIRHGAFVSFGTWDTGQTIQVMWPVFTSDALVYQCAERVDIQAVAIASGGAGVSIGNPAAGYPMCAAYVSDPLKLLNLLNSL